MKERLFQVQYFIADKTYSVGDAPHVEEVLMNPDNVKIRGRIAQGIVYAIVIETALAQLTFANPHENYSVVGVKAC